MCRQSRFMHHILNTLLLLRSASFWTKKNHLFQPEKWTCLSSFRLYQLRRLAAGVNGSCRSAKLPDKEPDCSANVLLPVGVTAPEWSRVAIAGRNAHIRGFGYFFFLSLFFIFCRLASSSLSQRASQTVGQSVSMVPRWMRWITLKHRVCKLTPAPRNLLARIRLLKSQLLKVFDCSWTFYLHFFHFELGIYPLKKKITIFFIH